METEKAAEGVEERENFKAKVRKPQIFLEIFSSQV